MPELVAQREELVSRLADIPTDRVLKMRINLLSWAIESKAKEAPDQAYFEEVKKSFGGQ